MKRNYALVWSRGWLTLALAPVAASFAAEDKASEPPVQLPPFEVSVDQGSGYRWPRYTDPRQFVYTMTVTF